MKIKSPVNQIPIYRDISVKGVKYEPISKPLYKISSITN